MVHQNTKERHSFDVGSNMISRPLALALFVASAAGQLGLGGIDSLLGGGTAATPSTVSGTGGLIGNIVDPNLDPLTGTWTFQGCYGDVDTDELGGVFQIAPLGQNMDATVCETICSAADILLPINYAVIYDTDFCICPSTVTRTLVQNDCFTPCVDLLLGSPGQQCGAAGKAVVFQRGAQTTPPASSLVPGEVGVLPSSILGGGGIEGLPTSLPDAGGLVSSILDGGGIGGLPTSLPDAGGLVSSILDGDGIGGLPTSLPDAGGLDSSILDGGGIGGLPTSLPDAGGLVSSILDGGGIGGLPTSLPDAGGLVSSILDGGGIGGLPTSLPDAGGLDSSILDGGGIGGLPTSLPDAGGLVSSILGGGGGVLPSSILGGGGGILSRTLGSTPSSTSSNSPIILESVVLGRIYEGCFVNIVGRTPLLTGASFLNIPTLSQDGCKARCTGFQYFGIDNGINCRCGNQSAHPATVAPNECNIPTAGSLLNGPIAGAAAVRDGLSKRAGVLEEGGGLNRISVWGDPNYVAPSGTPGGTPNFNGGNDWPPIRPPYPPGDGVDDYYYTGPSFGHKKGGHGGGDLGYGGHAGGSHGNGGHGDGGHWRG
ncbi:hypothetical protein PSPO01_15871 [Paraphaeosphaeria sporulosa]